MKGVYFDNIHSFNDLNLILSPFTPTPAEAQTNFLKIPGRDGFLDLTEANGEVKFNSREFEFTFTIHPSEEKTFDEKVSEISSLLNGRRCTIRLERDPDYYWNGRCAVNKYAQNKRLGQIVVKATVDPYKLKADETVASVELSSTPQVVALKNGRMPTVPFIECTDDGVVIAFNSTGYTLKAGKQQVLGIRFVEGDNILILGGKGTITFTWQEGEL